MSEATIAEIVSHYRPHDAAATAQRLTEHDVSIVDLLDAIDLDPERATEVLSLEALAANPVELSTETLMRISLLAEERAAVLRHEVASATRVRYAALRAAAERESIVAIARRLGISRQAVSQIVNGSEATQLTAGALTWLARRLKGER
ncbi:helix-turn-helix domain-containing protein [Frondihabitans sp. 4ASC-45]|uniref:helix-turn-helix domain-containing protein n=1 Tax=Frondihabitans sp. 4ASC-45 TaxID=3111636 RepID=UPI003C28862C